MEASLGCFMFASRTSFPGLGGIMLSRFLCRIQVHPSRIAERPQSAEL